MRAPLLALCLPLLVAPPAFSTTLKSMYDAASPGSGYDKYIVLEAGVTYTGGLGLGGSFNRITAQFELHDEDVRIVGHGAILDLQGGEICLAYTTRRLDIDDCVILNGNVRFRGYNGGGAGLIPQGSVRYVTFYRPHDYGVRLCGCGADILLERNLVVDAVDTGLDFQYLTGEPMEWLPTGTSFSLNVIAGSYPVFENWTFHTDPRVNEDPLRHFHFLCDYG